MMKPPQAPVSGSKTHADQPAAVSLHVVTLKKRRDFQRLSRADRTATPGFILQLRRHNDTDTDGIRVGFTCSKKVGNAVARNRAKRRLREIARLTLPTHGRDGFDYVLVGRASATAQLPFDALRRDLISALKKMHGASK